MEGKTHGKDIMLLCKGWYNKERYKTTKDALIVYYHKHYGNEDINPTYGFINEVLLKNTIQELLCDRYKNSFVDYLFKPYVFGTFNKKGLTYEEELYYRITEFISDLRVKEDDNTVIINTNDYWLKENGSEVIVDGHKILAEDII